jgi:hypothetical protein
LYQTIAELAMERSRSPSAPWKKVIYEIATVPGEEFQTAKPAIARTRKTTAKIKETRPSQKLAIESRFSKFVLPH